jgi:hypothetical protein
MTTREGHTPPKITALEPQIRTLIHYIRLAIAKTGTPLDGDCLSELESVREAFEKFDTALQGVEQ